jgi:hypothetical protein
LYKRYIGFQYFAGIRTLRPLDYINYNRTNALEELSNNTGFVDYGPKHHESILTRFAQGYYLPNKFTIDKRKSHLSSIIVSGQISREEALIILEKPLYAQKDREMDLAFICRKLNMSVEQLELTIAKPGVDHSEYPVSALTKFSSVARLFRILLSD